MKSIVGSAVFALAAGVCAPALAQMGVMTDRGTPHDPGGYDSQPLPAHKERADPEGVAEDLRLRGKCDKAVPILRGLVNDGEDVEVAQFNLGLCLIDLAKTDPSRAAMLNQEGATWILRAAKTGFGKAEAEAALLYLDGIGVPADPVEAEKWALIYHDNPMRLALGLPNLAPDAASRLDAALTDAQRAEAQKRADAWSPKTADPDR
jgi:TPR repeat protein